MTRERESDQAKPFRPTRRTFVTMLGVAAAALVVRDQLSGDRVIRNPATGIPIWIGHV